MEMVVNCDAEIVHTLFSNVKQSKQNGQLYLYKYRQKNQETSEFLFQKFIHKKNSLHLNISKYIYSMQLKICAFTLHLHSSERQQDNKIGRSNIKDTRCNHAITLLKILYIFHTKQFLYLSLMVFCAWFFKIYFVGLPK